MTKHRNPLFSRRTHLSCETCCVDELHTLFLGVFQKYILRVFWDLIQKKHWTNSRGGTTDVIVEANIQHLKQCLFTWYSQEKKKRTIYELQDLTKAMLGSKPTANKLHCKAAESGTLLRFAVQLARDHQHVLKNGGAVVAAGAALVEYLDVTRASGINISAANMQRLVDSMNRFLNLRELAEISWVPKTHLFVHLIVTIPKFGNPLFTGCWIDESLNNDLAIVARYAMPTVWYRRVLTSFRSSLGPTAKAALAAKKRKRRT